MRTVSGLLLGAAAAVGFVALAPARAAAPVIIEKSLLGVRILQTYHEVLAKLGQPKMICRFGEFILVEDEKNAQGQDTGAVKSISYEGGNGGAGGGGGAPGSGGGGMAPAAPGAAPGVPGGGMKGGGPGSGGGPGGGSSGSDPDTTFGETGGYAWIYTYPNHTAYIFFFNLEGRVFAIQETGITAGMPTQRGLRLGDPVKKLYETYGWPDTIQDQDVGFILDYSSKYHAKIAVVLGRVAGIGVELEENMKFTFFPPVNSNGGGGGPGGFGGAKGRAGGGGGGGSSAAGPQAAPPGL